MRMPPVPAPASLQQQQRDGTQPTSPVLKTVVADAHVEWAPAKLKDAHGGQTPAKAHALLELAKQLELVEHQRQQIIQKMHSDASGFRRPPSPATMILEPLHPVPASPTKTGRCPRPASPVSIGLAPSLSVSDVVVCDVCSAELASHVQLRSHKTTSCPLRIVTCPRAGCAASFPACERPAHDRADCVANKRTLQLLEDHQIAHTRVPCSVCGELAERRRMDDHLLFECVKREVACQYASFGCTMLFPFHHRATHEATECKVAMRRARIRADAATVNEEIECEWCTQRVHKRNLLEHQEDECPKRERPCPNALTGCKEWVPVENVDRHLKTECVVTLERNAMAARAKEMNTLVVCNECGAYVQRRHLSGHAAAECVSRIVNCKNAAHGCKARLRWRDRHMHEDFMALAMHERSMLCFPVSGTAYMVMNSETGAALEKRAVDLPPPWTIELFLWMVDAKEEILDLHRQCVDHVETIVMKQREHDRCQQQAAQCKKKLKQLQHKRGQQTTGKDHRSNSQILNDISLAAKELADEFNAAEHGATDAAEAIALAKGLLQLLLGEALRLFKEEEARDSSVAYEINAEIAAQAAELVAGRQLLTTELREEELDRLGDITVWAQAVTKPQATKLSAEEKAARQEKAAEQRKLLAKRAEYADLLSQVNGDDADAMRLKRKYERELTKVDAKLALVSDNTPTKLLERRGRHVILSSTKNAIALVGGSNGQVTYYRTSGSRTEASFPISLTRQRWHHVAFCASKQELTLVVDGEVKGIRRGAFELPFCRLGSNTQNGDAFQGYVQEVRVWTSSLSVDYLKAHSQAIVDAGRNADLFAYYTFEEGAGNVVDDMALRQPRAPCFNTQWVLYNTAAIRQKFGLPPTPSLRDKTSCIVNQRLKQLAQRARDRETEPVPCPLHCGQSMRVRELDGHIRGHCVHRVVGCREVGCEAVYRCSDTQSHLATDCQRYTYRETLVTQYWEKEALESCLLNCGRWIKKRHAEHHYQHECENRLRRCPQVDCAETIVASLTQAHLDHDCKSKRLQAERRRVARARRRQQLEQPIQEP